MRGEYEITLDLQEKLPEATGQGTRGEIEIPNSPSQKAGDNFFRRTKALYNLFIRLYKNYGQYLNKKTLLRIYYKFFKKPFTKNYKCIWRILCRRGH